MIANRISTTRISEGRNITLNISEKGIVEFEGYDFTSFCNSGKYGNAIETGAVHSLDNIEIESYVSSIVDGGGIINKKLGNKNLSFTIFIQGESNDDLINRIDEMKKRTQVSEGNLDIKVRGTWRRYKATIDSIIFPSIPITQDFIEGIQVNFLITSGYWEEYVGTSSVFPIIGTTNLNINNPGTYEAYPILQLVLGNSGNSLTKITVEIRKLGEVTGNQIYINGSFTNTDIIVFDYKNSIVMKNGIEIAFFNPMTPIIPGYTVITIIPTGTINGELTTTFNKTFL